MGILKSIEFKGSTSILTALMNGWLYRQGESVSVVNVETISEDCIKLWYMDNRKSFDAFNFADIPPVDWDDSTGNSKRSIQVTCKGVNLNTNMEGLYTGVFDYDNYEWLILTSDDQWVSAYYSMNINIKEWYYKKL